MAKLQPKAVVKPFASEETNPNLTPTPLGEWAGGGAVTPSLDPEVLLENASQGITKMTVQSSTSNIILPPASDIAGLYYSFTYFLKALQQTGIAEYRAVQDYHLNDITKAPSGSKIYRSLVNNNIGNPLTDITKWEELDLLALKQATISQRGTLQIATISDINAGTDNTKALTVANLRASNINFTGTPTAPTPATSDNSTKITTTQYVKANLVNYAPLSNPNFVGGNLKLTNNLNNRLFSIINFTNPSTPNNTSVVFRFTPNPNESTVYRDIFSAVFTNNVLQEITLHVATLPNANLTGTPTAPTPATSDNSTKIATTENVNAKINEMMVGQVQAYARQNLSDFPTNIGTGTWLYCDGRTLSTTAYPKLFAVLGNFYGGSGTSFNIPDLRERVVAGASSSEPINKKEGAKTHLLTINEMPEHKHVWADTQSTNWRHGTKNLPPFTQPAIPASGAATSSLGILSEPVGGNQPHNNMQPTIYLPYFIYAI